jgi:hypothetical protein
MGSIMTQKDIWEIGDRLKCPDCKVWMDRTIVRLQGIRVRAWRCPKCKEEAFHPIDAQKALLISKLKKIGIEVKVGELKEGPYVRFPKELSSVIKKGDIALIQAKSLDEFLIKIKHK